ncbi:hypothetical protein DD237_008178 [Peronospora effusa]|uniref:Uncharacterized protein n=1 Tax=Peronospora effusa TaxID=542832 RepID=A0A425C2D4_9STRA|nr:hypothetical protein DD237_008178 [Peronospora effusa]
MKSLVTPSSLLVRISGTLASKPQRNQSLELDNLDGEQSTCSLCSDVKRRSIVFDFCSTGSCFVFRGNDEIRKAQWEISEDPKQRPQNLCRENAFVKPVRMSNMSILLVSGRVTTIAKTSLRAKIASVLLPEQQNHQKEQPSTEVPTCKSCVRNLLHRIAKTSIESTALRTQSKHIDRQLKTLFSAL